MRTKLIIALIVITLLSLCSASVITQSTITSILQDIMSPANTEKAMQLINTAATSANKNIAMPTTVTARNECGLPVTITDLPATIFARNDPISIVNGIRRSRVVTNDGTRLLARESKVVNPEFVYPAQVVARQVVRDSPAYANMIDLKQTYQTSPVALPRENEGYPCRAPVRNSLPVGIPSNSYLPIATSANFYLPATTPTPNSYLPISAPNPYLPASIPNSFLPATPLLSAMSPPPLTPPTQSKGQFLKKIPKPPPML